MLTFSSSSSFSLMVVCDDGPSTKACVSHKDCNLYVERRDHVLHTEQGDALKVNE
jgi:hypothetical protein